MIYNQFIQSVILCLLSFVSLYSFVLLILVVFFFIFYLQNSINIIDYTITATTKN